MSTDREILERIDAKVDEHGATLHLLVDTVARHDRSLYGNGRAGVIETSQKTAERLASLVMVLSWCAGIVASIAAGAALLVWGQ